MRQAQSQRASSARRKAPPLLAGFVLAGLSLAAAACGGPQAGAAAPAPSSQSPSPGASAGAGTGAGSLSPGLPPVAGAPYKQAPGWQLAWQDNFSTRRSLKPWVYRTGGTGWGLNQLQMYTPGGAKVAGGALTLTAAKAHVPGCWDGTCAYTSQRLSTLGTYSRTYGVFEARIKVPMASGLWPAFWLEGTDVSQVSWPACGEIDVEEAPGFRPNLAQGFAHGPGFNHNGQYQLATPLSAGYHVYGVDWTPAGITWFVDGHAYSHVSTAGIAAFTRPFYITLNLAVGGKWPGSPKPSTRFPAHMDVDWVRVFSPAHHHGGPKHHHG